MSVAVGSGARPMEEDTVSYLSLSFVVHRLHVIMRIWLGMNVTSVGGAEQSLPGNA
jgi:hypothetical protein